MQSPGPPLRSAPGRSHPRQPPCSLRASIEGRTILDLRPTPGQIGEVSRLKDLVRPRQILQVALIVFRLKREDTPLLKNGGTPHWSGCFLNTERRLSKLPSDSTQANQPQ